MPIHTPVATSPSRPPVLLHVTASPRQDSLSTAVSSELAASWRAATSHRGRVLVRDVGAHPVPHITESWTEICDNLLRDGITDLDRLHLGARTTSQREAWSVLQPLLTELLTASIVVLATPMYNYSVPSSLKAWLDQVTFPRMDLSPRRFVVVAARGGSYDEGSPKAAVEHQTRYLSDFVQGHYNVVRPIIITVDLANSRVDPVLTSAQESHARSLQTAIQQARAVGAALGKEGGWA